MSCDFFVVSTNKEKQEHYSELLTELNFNPIVIAVALHEPQSMSVADVCNLKLEQFKNLSNHRPFVLDDTGIEIEGLSGFPGGLLKPILDAGGVGLLYKILSGLVDSKKQIAVDIVTAVGICWNNKSLVVHSRQQGILDFSDDRFYKDINCYGIFYSAGSRYSQRDVAMTHGVVAFAHRKEAFVQCASRLGIQI